MRADSAAAVDMTGQPKTAMEHNAAARDVAQRVRHVVGTIIAGGHGTPDIESTAATMRTSVRTLQRRLHATGLTYAGLVQQVRHAAARRMLEDARRRIGEISRTLGYSDQAHFTRAFHRWTGVSPRDFRRGRPGTSQPGPVRD